PVSSGEARITQYGPKANFRAVQDFSGANQGPEWKAVSPSPSQEDTMTDISTTTRSPSATSTCHGHAFRSAESIEFMDHALEIRPVTRTGKDRFEAAMTMAFSADPAARWAWPDPLQYLNTFIPLVTLFGGKSFEHGSAYVIGDFFGVAQWLPPGVLPDDGPIG